MNAAHNVRTGEFYQSFCVIRLLGTCSGNLKEEARSLTPPGCCMWVAPLLQARNLLLRYGDGEETRHEDWGPVVYFWRITSTNGDRYNRVDRHDGFGTGRS